MCTQLGTPFQGPRFQGPGETVRRNGWMRKGQAMEARPQGAYNLALSAQVGAGYTGSQEARAKG